jgi:hypothetical protein
MSEALREGEACCGWHIAARRVAAFLLDWGRDAGGGRSAGADTGNPTRHVGEPQAACGGRYQTPNEVPQPQVFLAFGLEKVNPLPFRPSEKSRTVPARNT